MCSNLVDIHDTLDPHTDSHLTKIHSSNYLKSIPLRFKLFYARKLMYHIHLKCQIFKMHSVKTNEQYLCIRPCLYKYGMQETIGRWKRHFC